MEAHELELFARCASGFERVLAQELRDLGMHRVRPLVGGVAFFGTQTSAYEACLWSRVATRIQLVVARVDARNAQRLYDGVRGVAWEDHVRAGATIAVRAHGTNEALGNTAFTALKVKDAVCDRLRDATGTRPNVDAHAPDLEVDVALHQSRATLYLNLSGESLHRRGYREDGVQTAAPLKETLAAGMLLAAGWDRLAREGASFIDPMCGSGTLAIEAVLIACDAAPGLLRTRWGHAGWARHDESLWERVLSHAEARRHAPVAGTRILAGDVDEDAIRIATHNVRRAGADGIVELFCDDAARLGRHIRALHRAGARGLLACNPPYGERLQTQTELAATYRALGEAIGALPKGWLVAAISPDARICTTLGRDPGLTLPCRNGALSTWVRTYDLADEPRACTIVSLAGHERRIHLADSHSEQFAARLRKAVRERRRWARKAGVDAYRVYEADLPDFPLSVDVYAPEADAEKPYALVRELVRPKADGKLASLRRLSDAEAVVYAVLDVPDGHVLTLPYDADGPKGRKHNNAAQRDATSTLVVREGTARHAIELARADETLPLVLREVRRQSASEARDKRVACVFATDAACAGAIAAARPASLVVVDASDRRCDAVREDLGLNGVPASAVRFQASNPSQWARAEQRSRRRYDLVVVVAPEWLSARDNGGREWDLVRDCPALVRDLARLLNDGGRIVLVTTQHVRGFDAHDLAGAGLAVRDLTTEVLPHDFARTRIPLRCHEVRIAS